MASQKSGSSKYFFRRRLNSDRNANISMACNGQMIFLSNWEYLSGGKTVRDKQRSIFLNLQRWKTLCFYMDDINAWIMKITAGETLEQKLHLGGNMFVSATSDFARVDIRFWYVPENRTELHAGKPGISLTFEEWYHLEKLMQEVNSELDLNSVQTCMVDLLHQSQKSAMSCAECHPQDRFQVDVSQKAIADKHIKSDANTTGVQEKDRADQWDMRKPSTSVRADFQDVRVKPYYNPKANYDEAEYNPRVKFNPTKNYYGY
jgi:hypothetical protein